MKQFERYQRDLITREYERKGYTVLTETDGGPRLDTVVRNASGTTVILELVHPNLSEEDIAARQLAIAQASVRYPNAMIDFRYIDVKRSAYFLFNTPDNADAGDPLKKLLSTRVPPVNPHPQNASKQLLLLWLAYASLLREYARKSQQIEVDTLPVMDLYNELLRVKVLEAAEISNDDVHDQLFQVYEAVIAATEGALVDISHVRQLRSHFMWLRKEIRSNLKAKNVYDEGVRR